MPEVMEADKQVEIYEDDLEEVLEVLQTMYRFCVSYDIFNQYKNLSANVSQSPLTKKVNATATLLQSILDDHYEQKKPETEDVPKE